MERKLLLCIAYDGAKFCGYQTQKNGHSVQQALCEGAATLFGFSCDITGCSRTDSGVHAHGFFATVTKHGTDSLPTTIPADRIPFALNRYLPPSVAVRYAKWVPTDFHVRYDVHSKEYVYRLKMIDTRDPFMEGRVWQYPRNLSYLQIRDMQKAAAQFVGEHDFAACMASGSSVKSTVRRVFSAEVTRDGSDLTFRVRANGFLYHMVRIMMGTLIDVAEGHIPASEIADRLRSRDRTAMGRTAPPEGLYLDGVYYDDGHLPGYHGPELDDDGQGACPRLAEEGRYE